MLLGCIEQAQKQNLWLLTAKAVAQSRTVRALSPWSGDCKAAKNGDNDVSIQEVLLVWPEQEGARIFRAAAAESRFCYASE